MSLLREMSLAFFRRAVIELGAPADEAEAEIADLTAEQLAIMDASMRAALELIVEPPEWDRVPLVEAILEERA